MSSILRNIIRFALFLLIQVFVLSKIPPLHQFIAPYLYFLFLLWMPFSIKRGALTLLGFGFGLALDYFLLTPGLHAAACTLMAYLRPFLINLLMEKETTGFKYKAPSIQSMGFARYSVYVVVLTLVHHVWLVCLEWMQFGSFFYFLAKVLATTAVSLLLIMIAELVFPRRENFRTNTA